MATAIAAGLLSPFQWLARAFTTDDAPVSPRATAAHGGEALCTICHENMAPASTDHRCFDCWLDCNAAP